MNNFNFVVVQIYENILEVLVDYLLSRYNVYGLDKICIIFGGKRPGSILKKLLSQKVEKAFYPPKTFSEDEFIFYLASQYKNIEFIKELEAVYLLYNTIKNKLPHIFKKFESFNRFLSWGYEIFGFFESILLEDVAEEKLLSIKNEAEIGYNVSKNTNEILKSILEIKNCYYEKIEQEGLFTRGMLYSFVSKLKDVKISDFSEIIFVSPFYLHETEKNMIMNLKENNKITLFLQGAPQEFKQLKSLYNLFGIQKCEIKDISHPDIFFYSMLDEEQEILCVNNLINKLEKDEISKTVIVLPDEKLGIPLINHLPENVKEFNYVCGYPIKNSPIYSFFEAIYNCQLSKKDILFNTKDYINLLKNCNLLQFKISNKQSYMVEIFANAIEEVLTGKLEDVDLTGSVFLDVKKIAKSEVLYKKISEELFELDRNIIDKYEYDKFIEDFHKILLLQWDNIDTFEKFSNHLRYLLDLVRNNVHRLNYGFHYEAVDKIYDFLNLLGSLSFSKEKFKIEEMFEIFLTEITKLYIVLSGSPIRGLQILGFYETRDLSFDNVIILDVNEGVLPYLRFKNVFIPREILVKIGLDRIEIEEEIQRYHFYRLIKNAKKVHLIFIESRDREKSRFIEELIWKKQKEQGNLEIKNVYTGSYNLKISSSKKIVEKTDKIISYLSKMQYSSSSIDTYLYCPLMFYYKYVLGLKEVDELDEPESKDIGKFIHNYLKIVFQSYIGKSPVIDDNFIKSSLVLLNEAFEKELKKRYRTESFIFKEVIEFVVEQFFVYERNRIENIKMKKIVSLEETFTREIILNDKKYKFKCITDRIDELEDGSLLIIDYKTTDKQVMAKKLNELKTLKRCDRELIRRKIKSFQLPIYVKVVSDYLNTKNVNAALYIITQLELKPLINDREKEIENLDIAMNVLGYLMEEIFDKQHPFIADDTDSNLCKSCNYKLLCR